MKPKLLLVGAGGHCRSCIEVVESSERWVILGVVGTAEQLGQTVLGYPILGTDDQLKQFALSCPNALVALGQIKSPALRKRVHGEVISAGMRLPVITAATSTVSNRASLGAGSIVMHGATINAGARVGKNGIVNTHAVVEHDVRIGDHCHVSTGAIINGGVVIGDDCFIGSGAVIHHGVKIGAESVIGARTLIVRDLPELSKVRVDV